MTWHDGRRANYCALATLLGLCGQSCARAEAEPQPDRALAVRVIELEQRPTEEYSEYLASLTSRQSLTLYPRVTGYVSAIRVKPGQPVQQGELLLEIDKRMPAATLRGLIANAATRKANRSYAVQNEESARELARQGVISQLEYLQRVSQRAAAEAEVSAAEAQVQAQAQVLAFHRITAPVGGRAGDVPVKVGDYVTPQTRVASVDQSQLIEAYVYIPVDKLDELGPDSTIALLGDDGQPRCQEKATFIAPEVSVDTQSVLVKTACANAGDLRSAQVLKARVIWSKRPRVTVPTTAVSQLSGQHFVFVARPEPRGLVARQTPIELGPIQGNDYVVSGGLEPGDRVVVSNLQKVRDGTPISPAAAGQR